MNKSDFLEAVSSLDCVVCGARPVEIHHIESIRDNDSDYLCAALCPECHRGHNGVHGSSRMGFERRTKISQTDLVKRTIKALWRTL
jgi:hypothetical protein